MKGIIHHPPNKKLKELYSEIDESDVLRFEYYFCARFYSEKLLTKYYIDISKVNFFKLIWFYVFESSIFAMSVFGFMSCFKMGYYWLALTIVLFGAICKFLYNHVYMTSIYFRCKISYFNYWKKYRMHKK